MKRPLQIPAIRRDVLALCLLSSIVFAMTLIFVSFDPTTMNSITGAATVTIGSNARLEIWDETDNSSYANAAQVKYILQNITFFSNFTDKNSNLSINGTNVYCSFTSNGAGWSTRVNMTFNTSTLIYQYSRPFTTSGNLTWNSTCDGTAFGYNQLNASDSVTINKTIITTYKNRTVVINSFHLSANPHNVTIDGNPCTGGTCVTSKEWNDSLSNARSIVDVDDNLTAVLQVRIKHDDTFLYVFADLMADASDQVDDYVNVALDTKNDGGPAPQNDDYRFQQAAGSSDISTAFRGNGTDWVTMTVPGWSGTSQKGVSPSEASSHLTFEFKINLTAINASVNNTIGFMVHGYGTPTAGGNTYWPAGAVKRDENDYDVPGFNYSTTEGSSANLIKALPDTWGTLVPHLDPPGTYSQTLTEENMTVFELHNINYESEYVLRLIGSLSSNQSKTGMSRSVANSDKSLGALHNKTSQVFVGDHIDLYTKDSEQILKPFIFINRPMFLYNKTDGKTYNISLNSANVSSCRVSENRSDLSAIECNWRNDDVELTGRYIVRAANTHMSMFFNAISLLQTNLTGIALYNYFDYDLTKPSGSETQDDFYAIVQSTANTTVSEQVNKEGQVVCDSHGEANAIDLTKCSEAVNDSFFIRQSKGSGEAGGDIFGTEATKFVPASVLSTFIGFTNPSTDTDNIREVPDQTMDVNDPGLMNKADLTGAIQVRGTTLPVGGEFQKYFALATATTEAELINRVNENVPGVPLDIQEGEPHLVLNGTLTQVNRSGAYRPLNMITDKANTGFLAIIVNQTCNMTDPKSRVVVSSNYVFNITATDPVKHAYCGGATPDNATVFNQDNAWIPGKYTLEAYAFMVGSASINDYASNNFTVLTDYVGNLTLRLNQTLLNCNETVNITVNLTNTGNTNFTGNLSIDLYYADPQTYVSNLYNISYFLEKDGKNSTSLTKNATECPFNRTYMVKSNFTTSDENNGTEVRFDSKFYTFHLWSYFYGETIGNVTLRDQLNRTVIKWDTGNAPVNGTVYVVDSDSVINWFLIKPLGYKNDSVTAASSDFSEADFVLNITETRADNITVLYSTDGTTARNRTTTTTRGYLYNTTPIANSTNNTAFATGIFWDSGDDTGGLEFDNVTKEDLVFATIIEQNRTGTYGTYDYELRVPERLRSYKGTTDTVSFYLEVR